MATLAALAADARAILHEPDTGFFSTSDIAGWANEAEREVASRARCIEGSLTLSTVVDQRTYTLTAANRVLGLIEVTIQDDDGDTVVLDTITRGELHAIDAAWRSTDSGDPSRAYMDTDTSLGLYPPPDTAARTITVHYWGLPTTDLDGDNPTTSTPQIPLRFHDLITLWLCYRAKQSDEEYQDGDRYLVEFERRLDQRIGEREDLIQSAGDARVAHKYMRDSYLKGF